jgi:uncharacterized protein
MPTGRTKNRHRKLPSMPEVRHFKADGLEIREAGKTNKIVIDGDPIVYRDAAGQPTEYSVTDCFGSFGETMAPGVATDVLARGADVRFLLNHDGLPLARSTAGTLTLTDTPDSLKFTATLDARQQLANDLAVAIERGDISQMSCGFIVARDEWDEDMEHRTILSFADLLDISAVAYAASPTTSVQVAQRMAMEVPVESRARLRRLISDVGQGKQLSGRELAGLRGLLGGEAPVSTASSGRRSSGRQLSSSASTLRRVRAATRATNGAASRAILDEIKKRAA